MNKETNQNKLFVIILASLTVVCTQAGIMMYSPSIPYLSKVFNVSYTEIAYTLTAYLLGYALAVLFFGGVSDQIGRKRGYVITTALYCITSLMLAITHSIYPFIILRFVQGIGGGGGAVIARASVRDVCEGKELVSAMSYVSISFVISMGIFQYLGGLFQTYANYKYNFLFMLCFGLMVFILVLFKFKETHYQSKKNIIINRLMKDYSKIIREKYLLLIAVGGGIGYSALLAFNILGVYYLQYKFKVSPTAIGVIGIYFSLAYLFGSILINRLVKTFEIESLIKVGKTIILIAGILELLSAFYNENSLFVIIIPLLIGQIGQALVYPCAMTKALEPYRSSSGAASSLFGFTQQFCGFLVSMVVAWLPYKHLLSLGLVIFIVGSISFLLLNDDVIHKNNFAS